MEIKSYIRKLSVILLLSPAAVLAAELEIQNPWVREAPPSARALAGYMVISNVSKAPVKLIKAESPAFEKIEFHITEFEGGMMRMKHLESLEIQSGEQLEFEPGGKHLMLINPTQRVKAGDAIPITLTTDREAVLRIDMEVRK